MKNSQFEQPSDTFVFLYKFIIQELFSQICNKCTNYSVKPKIKNDEIHIAIWKKYEEYRKRALSNMSGTRLDRHKLASCICGALIEIKPLEGFHGAKINKYANELFALYVGLNVIKVFMIRDLVIRPDKMRTMVNYLKDHFTMEFPSLEYNVCDKRCYANNLRNALSVTHHICEFKHSECFHYDIMAYAKIFYHLELYNKERLHYTYHEYLKNLSEA